MREETCIILGMAYSLSSLYSKVSITAFRIFSVTLDCLVILIISRSLVCGKRIGSGEVAFGDGLRREDEDEEGFDLLLAETDLSLPGAL